MNPAGSPVNRPRDKRRRTRTNREDPMRTVIGFLAAAAFASATAAALAGDEPAKAGEQPKVKGALEQAAKFESYTFTVTTETEGGRPGQARGPVDGKFAKDKGLWVKTGETELYKLGDASVAK